MIRVANDEQRLARRSIQEHELDDFQADESLPGSRWSLDDTELVLESAPDGSKLFGVQDRVFLRGPLLNPVLC